MIDIIIMSHKIIVIQNILLKELFQNENKKICKRRYNTSYRYL